MLVCQSEPYSVTTRRVPRAEVILSLLLEAGYDLSANQGDESKLPGELYLDGMESQILLASNQTRQSLALPSRIDYSPGDDTSSRAYR